MLLRDNDEDDPRPSSTLFVDEFLLPSSPLSLHAREEVRSKLPRLLMLPRPGFSIDTELDRWVLRIFAIKSSISAASMSLLRPSPPAPSCLLGPSYRRPLLPPASSRRPDACAVRSVLPSRSELKLILDLNGGRSAVSSHASQLQPSAAARAPFFTCWGGLLSCVGLYLSAHSVLWHVACKSVCKTKKSDFKLLPMPSGCTSAREVRRPRYYHRDSVLVGDEGLPPSSTSLQIKTLTEKTFRISA